MVGTAWYNNQPDGLLYAGMIAYKYKGTMATGTKITLEEGTLGIGESAFEGCSGLTSITIPNSVTSIGYSAFSGCSGLTSITIPSSVTIIGSSAFRGCSGLTKAEFASIESLFKIKFGDDSSNPLYYAKHLYINGQEVTDVVIPNSVTSIGSYAFRGCSGLTSVTIPSSVTSIGQGAFSYCSGLKSVTIPNSVTSIGNQAFYNCSGLTSVTLNANYIVSKTYSSSSNLGTIFGTQVKEYVLGDDVKGIGNQAFYKCSGLTSITIPNSVTSIGNQAFSGCSGLTSVTLNAKYIVSKTYSSSSNLGTIFGTQVKEYVLGDDVKGIGDWAFSGCSGLTSVTIGNSVKSIGSSAFSGCRGLTSITIGSSVTSIGSSAFSGCSGLTSITIGSSVTSIGDNAFERCIGLTSVTIGNSVKSIGDYAFSGCSGLTSVTIPKSVTSIGVCVFYNCSGLTSVTIPNSVTNIGNSAFYGCTGLTSVTIPNSVTSIEYHAFRNCSGLTSVTIPNSVKSIRDYAFSGCSRLTSVTIGNSVTSIGNYAFNGCSRLEEVILNSNSIVSQTYTSTGNISTIFGSQVKKYILGDNITGIGEYAFPSNTSIYVSAKSSLLAAWNYGISPYDLKTSVLLANPLPTVQTNTASSIHVSRNSSAEESGIISISSESITAAGVTITKIGHTTKFTGLTPNTAYTVAYNSTIKYAGSTFSYSNEYRATTNALTLTTSQPKVISAGNVVVGAVSNLDDAEENVGFEWRRTDWTDDFASNTGAAYLYEGTMEGYIRNLYTEKLWKVRPYYKSNDGKFYYGEWVGLDPTNTSYFEPTVHTYARIDQTENKVQISGYVQRGTDDVSKQGFKYWVQEDNARGAGISIPSGAKTIEAEGRVMEVELTGLKPNTTYAYVAFVTTTEGETFYGKQLSFTTGDDPEASVTGDANGNGVVEIGDVTSVLTLMATPEATGYNNKAADANGNGVIEIGDVTTILTIMANGE